SLATRHTTLLPSLSHHYPHPRDLHSFPTRRSSDLAADHQRADHADERDEPGRHRPQERRAGPPHGVLRPEDAAGGAVLGRRTPRSEEHTSELQSLTNLVCRLLLEKKKKHVLTHKTV